MIKKSTFTLAVCLCLAFSGCKKAPSAHTVAEPILPLVTTAAPTEPVTIPEPTLPPVHTEAISSEFASAFKCLDDDRLTHSFNIHGKIAPASLTKLLTAITALKFVPIDEVVTVGNEICMVQPYSSLCHISEGQQLTFRDLLKGLLMSSGNDAAYTVAVTAARMAESEPEMSNADAVSTFCRLMNETAAEIGMTESNFVNPEGWDDAEQQTTVSDLLILAEHAAKVPEIREISAIVTEEVTTVSGDGLTWHNSNRLLHEEDGFYCASAIGLKTGSTVDAGYCLIALFEDDGKEYISVVVGCASDEDRYNVSLYLHNNFAE